MKKLVRTLDFYGYGENNNFSRDDDKLFPISDVVEVKNKKFVFGKKGEENNDETLENGDTETQG